MLRYATPSVEKPKEQPLISEQSRVIVEEPRPIIKEQEAERIQHQPTPPVQQNSPKPPKAFNLEKFIGENLINKYGYW